MGHRLSGLTQISKTKVEGRVRLFLFGPKAFILRYTKDLLNHMSSLLPLFCLQDNVAHFSFPFNFEMFYKTDLLGYGATKGAFFYGLLQ